MRRRLPVRRRGRHRDRAALGRLDLARHADSERRPRGSWDDDSGAVRTLAARWDGTQWSVVATPSPGSIASYLASVTALTADDVWAVGYQVTSAARYETLALHWDGSGWQVVPAPNPGAGDNLLEAVAASAHDDAWAAGLLESGAATETLVLHWDGSVWSRSASPNPGLTSNALHACTRARATMPGSSAHGTTATTICR